MRGQAEPGQLDLGDGEEAGHEVLVAELHLEDVHVERRLAAPPEADLTHRGLPPGQLLKARAHARGARRRLSADFRRPRRGVALPGLSETSADSEEFVTGS